MLNILLDKMDLTHKKYFKQYDLSENFLIIRAEENENNDSLRSELTSITKFISPTIFDYAVESNTVSISIKPIFQDITETIKEHMNDKDILFPVEYNNLFLEAALDKDSSFNINDFKCSEVLNDQITSHVLKLDKCANEALTAMIDENKEELENIINETRELKEKIKELKNSVYEDSLTKVHNRKWLDDNYTDNKTEAFLIPGVLLLIDMNDFKFINDSYGHAVGDKVLVFIANKLRSLGGDVIRYGGDEFFVIFQDEISVEKIHDKIHILRELVVKKKLKASGHNIKVSFSYGITKFESGSKMVSSLAAADNSMYMDKEAFKSRKNRV